MPVIYAGPITRAARQDDIYAVGALVWMGRWIFACDAYGRATLRTIIVSSTLRERLCTYINTQFRTVIVQSECIRGVFHVNYYFSKHTLCVYKISELHYSTHGEWERKARARTEQQQFLLTPPPPLRCAASERIAGSHDSENSKQADIANCSLTVVQKK